MQSGIQHTPNKFAWMEKTYFRFVVEDLYLKKKQLYVYFSLKVA